MAVATRKYLFIRTNSGTVSPPCSTIPSPAGRTAGPMLHWWIGWLWLVSCHGTGSAMLITSAQTSAPPACSAAVVNRISFGAGSNSFGVSAAVTAVSRRMPLEQGRQTQNDLQICYCATSISEYRYHTYSTCICQPAEVHTAAVALLTITTNAWVRCHLIFTLLCNLPLFDYTLSLHSHYSFQGANDLAKRC